MAECVLGKDGAIRRLTCLMAALLGVFGTRPAWAEGTAQLGANQDVYGSGFDAGLNANVRGTVVEVDILAVGEVINISAGNNHATDTSAIEVSVYDPAGTEIAGSPFTVAEGEPGWLATPGVVPTPADVATPLQILTTQTGAYRIEFDNLGTAAEREQDQGYIDPLDITVTPDASTPVDPANPPGGYGRVHSREWNLSGVYWDETGQTNAEFFVLVPTGPSTDYTWLLKFEGLAGYKYQVSGNDIGLPAPFSGFSEDGEVLAAAGIYGPTPMYEIYLKVPEVARGGNAQPTLRSFDYDGPTALCECSVVGLESTFTFESDVEGIYEIIIDVDQDGNFDSATGDVLLRGLAESGLNTVSWDGTDPDGASLAPSDSGGYEVRLSVRLGEFHFVASDVETSKPGLRIFGVHEDDFSAPTPSTPRRATAMFWDDSRINSLVSHAHPNCTATDLSEPCPLPAQPGDPDPTIPDLQRSVPESTIALGGLSTGAYTDSAVCGNEPTTLPEDINAHCWGDFEVNEPRSPGNYRSIDTYVFFTESVRTTTACVMAPGADRDDDGVSNLEECSSQSPMDPNDADTDGDGISDGDELGGNVVTDPTASDTDHDGIPDGVEDADRDGSFESGETDPGSPDTDGDGIEDGVEDSNQDGAVDPAETDPRRDDSDGDGLLDGVEDSNQNGTVDSDETDPADADSDGDGLQDGVEDSNQDGSIDTGETDPRDPDTDADGIRDGIEDADQDGVYDADETDPLAPDTDSDGLADGVEDANQDGSVDPDETDPRLADTDNDGLDDGEEDGNGNGAVDSDETDPRNPDTDGDGLPDGVEDANRNGVVDAGESDPGNADTDGDGLDDGVEDANGNGFVDTGETRATEPDSDADGLDDGEEDSNANGTVDAGESDPTVEDTDGDGLADGIERGREADGSAIDDPYLSDPLVPDTDGDGLEDGEEDRNANGTVDVRESDPTDADTDGDGLSDGIERGINPDGTEIARANPTDPAEADTDGDRIVDGVEDANHNGVFNPRSETDPNQVDTDGDELRDGREDRNRNGEVDRGETDPREADTDQGGEPDGSEVLLTGHDPLDPADDRPPEVALYGGGCACQTGTGARRGLGGWSALLGLLWIAARRRRTVRLSSSAGGLSS